MAIFFPPTPPVFVGGAQPYGPSEAAVTDSPINPVNNPPFGYPGRLATLIAGLAQAQPDPWSRAELGPAGGLGPYAQRLLNPSITAVEVDNPPTGYPAQIANVMAGVFEAQPDPYSKSELGSISGAQPYGPRQMSPAIPGMSADPPPFAHPERQGGLAEVDLSDIKQIWQPNPWVYNFLGGGGGAQPYAPSHLPPQITAVEVDNPPFDRRRMETLAEQASIAQPNPWTYTFEGGLAPFLPRQLTQVSFNNPPPFDKRRIETLSEIVRVWQPDPWVYDILGPDGGSQPYAPRQLSPAIPGQSSDPPPFDARRAATNVELIAANQPAIWNYDYEGWGQPYQGVPVSPVIEGIPVPIPGAGKRKNFPAYIPQPAYDVEPRKPIRQKRDFGGKVDQPKPAPVAAPSPLAPPALPPMSLFGERAPVSLTGANGLPTFQEYVPQDSMALSRHMQDVRDMNDVIALLKSLGVLK